MTTRRIIRIEGVAEALEPIIHGGEKSGGTITEFRREKMRVGDLFEYLPVISANSVAGILRDQCAFWCLDAIGYEQFKDLRAFDLLTSGGALTKAGAGGKKPERYVDLGEERTLRELFPVVSLFGGSVGNRIIGGRIDVDRWVPVCVETRAALPDDLQALAGRDSIADLLQEVQFTRRDDKKNRNWQDFIDPATLAKHQAEQAGRAEDERTDEPGAATSMRYGFEALAQGSLFSVGFTLRNPTDVELGVFFGGLGYFYARPKIGGRGARGFGKVRLDLKQYHLVGPGRVENELALAAVATAEAHLQARRADIIRALESL